MINATVFLANGEELEYSFDFDSFDVESKDGVVAFKDKDSWVLLSTHNFTVIEGYADDDDDEDGSDGPDLKVVA